MHYINGKAVGRVMEVDLEENEMACRNYMRVRVCLDVSKPLLRGKKVYVSSTMPIWVRFT